MKQIWANIIIWNKKMLSQVFKWDDKSKALILDNIDESKVLSERALFIAQELVEQLNSQSRKSSRN